MKFVIFLLSLIVIISCTGPLDKVYNDETLEQDTKSINENSNLSDDDLQLLAGWIVRSKLLNEDLTGKTYNEILKEANQFRLEEKELAIKVKKEVEDRRAKLGNSLTVAMYDKGFEKYDYQEYLTYSLAFQNNSDKDIRAFKGSLDLNDLFGTTIKSINLTIDDPIKSGETFKGTYTTNYNQFIDEDSRLKGKDLADLIVVWTPEKIIFSDGTILE